MRWLVLCALLCLPFPALAQDKAQTLADLQAELAQLSADFNGLKAELVQSGAASSGAAGGDALQRMDAIEAALDADHRQDRGDRIEGQPGGQRWHQPDRRSWNSGCASRPRAAIRRISRKPRCWAAIRRRLPVASDPAPVAG